MKVCEKVEKKGVTTYNEVADELVSELSDLQGGLSDFVSPRLLMCHILLQFVLITVASNDCEMFCCCHHASFTDTFAVLFQRFFLFKCDKECI